MGLGFFRGDGAMAAISAGMLALFRWKKWL